MGEIGDDIFQYFAPPARSAEGNQERSSGQQDQPPTPISNLVQNLLTNMLGQNVDLAAGGTPTGEGHGRSEEDETGRPMIFFGNMVDGNVRFEPMPAGAGRMPGSMPRNREGEENSNGNENPETNPTQEMRGNSIASILQFLSAMTGAPIDGGLVGNPNDYVFSQTALDNIITQLMEQAGSASAPPPAPEQVIDSLPKRSLTDKEKTQEIDCAVCKDNFEPTEQVIELPCLHIFHDDCIKPWLKLNGTCPVCRHSVVPEQESDNNNNNSNNNDNSNNDNDNQDTQMETNNAENTQNTQPSNNDRAESHTTTSSQGNNNASHTASFTIVSGNFPGTHSGSGTPTSWPLNLSSAFPWASHLSRSSQQNNASDNNNENESNSHHEDLDLD
ncbi:hypothetical protein BD560DRAFT_404406 [Blakeslea trispora]|nr:hypothetical protein BD560DRAFT_404406 [Blakeslea trispora]